MEVLHTQEMVLVDDEQVGKPKVRSHSHRLPPSPPPNYDATHSAGSVLHNSCQIFLVPPLPPLHHVSTSKKMHLHDEVRLLPHWEPRVEDAPRLLQQRGPYVLAGMGHDGREQLCADLRAQRSGLRPCLARSRSGASACMCGGRRQCLKAPGGQARCARWCAAASACGRVACCSQCLRARSLLWPVPAGA